jgi:hypothetical protein
MRGTINIYIYHMLCFVLSLPTVSPPPSLFMLNGRHNAKNIASRQPRGTAPCRSVILAAARVQPLPPYIILTLPLSNILGARQEEGKATCRLHRKSPKGYNKFKTREKQTSPVHTVHLAIG